MRPSSSPAAAAVRTAPLLLAVLLTAAVRAPAAGQEPMGRDRACTLVLEPATDSTRSTAFQVAEGQYVTHVGNGLRWTCGSAQMYADSAVKYDRERRLKAIGAIDYRDSVRTLTADTLTYYEAEDRLVAEGDAVLRRRDRSSTLAGPRIEFLRAASGVERRTVATGRPHLTVRPAAADGDSAPPTELDADRIVLVGRDEVRSWGEVRIERPDVNASADSAFFFLEEGEGRLFGTPEVRGQSFTLHGETIRTGFEEGELRQVVARDSARASGEGFELYASLIRARLADRAIERLWAHGEGRSVALAPPYRLEADSLAFRFRGGRLDTLRALVGAEAVEVGDSLPGDPYRSLPLEVGDRGWLAADTLVMAFAGDSADAAPDTADGTGATPAPAAPVDTGAPPPEAGGAPTDGRGPAPTPGEGHTRLRRVHALGSARAYRVMRPEEGSSGPPSRHYQRGREIVVEFRDGQAVRVRGEWAIGVHLDPLAGAETPEGAVAGPGGDAAGDTAAVPPDTGAAMPDDSAAGGDTAPADTADRPAPAPPDSVPADATAAPGRTPPGSGRVRSLVPLVSPGPHPSARRP